MSLSFYLFFLIQLKPLGYVFALNRNGYVVFHPGLKPQVADVEDPPKLDWLDLEFDVGGRKTEIRRKMIDNEDGTDSILDFIKVADSIHTYSTTRNIVFTGTPNTKFG
ncbi:hypothetical protein AHF37_06220 [Paragonimus kellicotti]|nr:hypothetical protein AHF37_06220 [Paragonimus kellicotti]